IYTDICITFFFYAPLLIKQHNAETTREFFKNRINHSVIFAYLLYTVDTRAVALDKADFLKGFRVLILISLIQFCTVSFPNNTPLISPLSSTPTYTDPPLALANATNVVITSS